MSSLVHRIGRIRTDLNWEHGRYERWLAYGQSKLANLMFAYELQHRLLAAGSPIRSMAAHPGYSSTNLQSHTESIQDRLMGIGNKIFAQSAEMGALPELFAATMPDLPCGTYIGPDGFGERAGHPRPVGSIKASHDLEKQRALWETSEKLTGVTFDFTAQRAG
jgi:NAD(P)-dependent dehydrogenase (short-subunit alcohol dehydrogenase family)